MWILRAVIFSEINLLSVDAPLIFTLKLRAVKNKYQGSKVMGTYLQPVTLRDSNAPHRCDKGRTDYRFSTDWFIIKSNFIDKKVSMEKHYDLAVIGGGPGGYVAAIRGSQLNKNVILFEKEKVGGTCMNWGCIPTKYLLHETHVFHQAKKHKNLEGPVSEIICNWTKVQKQRERIVARLVKGVEFLLEKNGVTLVKQAVSLRNGREIVSANGDVDFRVTADKIILATGSESASLPFLKPDGIRVITSREGLELDPVPEKMLVIGAGAIGLEMGTIFRRLGSQVKILEILPGIMPGCETELGSRLERSLKAKGLKILTQMRVENKIIAPDSIKLEGTCLRDQSPFSFEADMVLLATGRKPLSQDLLNENPGLKSGKGGFISVNDRLETSLPGVYAIGDLNGGQLLAHKASHEGMIAAENSAGADHKMSTNAIPAAVFTDPEYASVGMTEEQARADSGEVKIGQFPLSASGRALTMGSQDGMVKIIADGSERVLGAHIVAPHASEFIGELTLAINRGLKLSDVAAAIHIHPTLSETVMEAALHAKGEAIQILN